MSTLIIDVPENKTATIGSATETHGGEEDLDSSKLTLMIGGILLALIGVVLFMQVQRMFGWTSKTILLGMLCTYGFISTCCALGGLDNYYYILMVPVTLMLGAQQAYQRALYSNLAPVGKEAAMFAFYTITDKGSSLIGYAVIGVVHSSTHSYVGTFWYCALAFFTSAAILSSVDVEQGMRDAGKGDTQTAPSMGETSQQDTELQDVAR